jgi:hypothetical protein
MSAQSPDPSITADTVPGRRGALTASPSQAVPATDTPGGGKLPQRRSGRRAGAQFISCVILFPAPPDGATGWTVRSLGRWCKGARGWI